MTIKAAFDNDALTGRLLHSFFFRFSVLFSRFSLLNGFCSFYLVEKERWNKI